MWQYALTGAGTTVAVGASSLYLGGLLIPKRRRKPPETPIENPVGDDAGSESGPAVVSQNVAANSDVDVQVAQLQAAFGLENWGRSLKNNDDGSLTTTQTIVGSALLCTGLFLMNMRTVSIWKGRKIRGNLDAEAFLRGFEKFMNEQAGNAGAGQRRAGAGAKQRQETREEFERFWRDFERQEKAYNERRQRMYEDFGRQRANFRREHGEDFAGSAFPSSDPWQSPQVREALKQLGLAHVEQALSAKELKAAYLKAVMEWHPDRVPEDQKVAAGEKFKQISAAYATLRLRVAKD